MRAVLSSLAALLLLSFAGTASADIPPPPGYVETCTAAIQQRAGGHCEECGSYYGTVTKCPDHYAGTAFTKRCQSNGASVWTEVWCDAPASAQPPAPPAPAQPHAAPAHPFAPAAHSGGCDVAGARGGLLALLFGTALAAFVLARRGLGVSGRFTSTRKRS